MDLWIRSQDKKTLMKIKRLYIFSNAIFSVDTRENEIILGTYKKDKRALGILDEIQDLLKGNVDDNHINKFDIYNSDAIKIYEMPKE